MFWEDVPRSGSEIIAARMRARAVVVAWCKMLGGGLGWVEGRAKCGVHIHKENEKSLSGKMRVKKCVDIIDEGLRTTIPGILLILPIVLIHGVIAK